MTEADGEHFAPDAEPATSKAIQSQDEEETEDEEVKRTCIAFLSGIHESDSSSDSEATDGEDQESEDDDDEEDDVDISNDDDGDIDCQSNIDEQEGLVVFISGQVPKQDGTIYRPTPMIPKLPTHTEERERNSSDSEESRSVNARGAALSLTTDSNADMDSLRDDDEEEEEEEENDDDAEEDKELDEIDEESCASDDPADDIKDEDGDENDIEQGQEDDSENEAYAIVGASGASVEDLWSVAKQKRVLSSNTLSTLTREAGVHSTVSKRFRSSPPIFDGVMPEISLGLAAFDQILPLPRQYLMRGDSPFQSSDEEGDKILSEELEESPSGDYATSPIPLLTPPQSPRRECVLLDDEDTSAVEWPSNLVVDSAMMIAVTDLRPMSPASLQDLEEHEEERLRQADASSLTPLLRSIYVGNI